MNEIDLHLSMTCNSDTEFEEKEKMGKELLALRETLSEMKQENESLKTLAESLTDQVYDFKYGGKCSQQVCMRCFCVCVCVFFFMNCVCLCL